MKKERKSQAILLSKRSNVFYLEHARVMQKDDRVLYFLEDGQPIEKAFGIPDKNTAFLLLGKGTSITDAAVRKLAESNVVIGFCGSGGSPLFGALDLAFMTPEDCYRPTQYAQAWLEKWMDEGKRVQLAKVFIEKRIRWTIEAWVKQGLTIPPETIRKLREVTARPSSGIPELLSAEGAWAKSLYAYLAQLHGMSGFSRDEGQRRKDGAINLANSFLDHGNYIAYGYAATALHGLGIPYCFPIIHGKTRRGALVFDVADLIKDGLVMPMAFVAAKNSELDQQFRQKLIGRSQEWEVLDELMTFIKEVCALKH